MSIRVKPRDKAADKFRRRVEVAGPDYEAGVRSPRKNWLENFRAVAEAIAEAIRQMVEERRFLAGAERVGVAKWQEGAIRKGVPRWREETPRRAAAWQAGYDPFARELEAMVLAPRRPKGDPANIDNRVKAVVGTLRRKKLELRGAKPS